MPCLLLPFRVNITFPALGGQFQADNNSKHPNSTQPE